MAEFAEDLAYIHHQGFSGFALESAPGLLALLRRAGIDAGYVVDLGCGSGVWARQLGFAGYDVYGIDVSPAMIGIARETAPKAEFAVASLTHAAIPKCDAVTALGECFSYAFASDSSGNMLRRVLRRIHKALSTGGLLVFDYAKPGREPAGMPRKAFWASTDWAVLLEAQATGFVVRRQLTTFRKVRSAYRRHEEVHLLRTWQPDTISGALEASGFAEVKHLRAYGSYRFRSGHGGVVARKR